MFIFQIERSKVEAPLIRGVNRGAEVEAPFRAAWGDLAGGMVIALTLLADKDEPKVSKLPSQQPPNRQLTRVLLSTGRCWALLRR